VQYGPDRNWLMSTIVRPASGNCLSMLMADASCRRRERYHDFHKLLLILPM